LPSTILRLAFGFGPQPEDLERGACASVPVLPPVARATCLCRAATCRAGWEEGLFFLTLQAALPFRRAGGPAARAGCPCHPSPSVPVPRRLGAERSLGFRPGGTPEHSPAFHAGIGGARLRRAVERAERGERSEHLPGGTSVW
jgi:hypothetical protein